ncbi:DUF1351 domain-containing protein [Tissierellaceae bacterium HCP3S3_D8]
MNELQIITNDFQPAKVDFNYEQISNQLDEVLKKYDGLVFTEETVQDCNKTITELRKGKRSLDDFRKKTKKELTKSVTEFENQCKELNKKFDEVIDPLVEQSDFFEEQRRNEKKEKVQKIVDGLIIEYDLSEKYSNQIIIKDEYLNKSKSMKSIEDDLKEIVENLKSNENLEKSNIELISGIVKSVNSKDGLQLIPDAYIRLLEYEDVNSIVAKIYADAEMQKPVKEVDTEDEPEENILFAVDFGTREIKENIEIFMERYEIEGTEKQLDALEKFLDNNFSTWKVIE